MEDNKILFVDLDGTLIKEDLSDLAFIHSIKNYPFKTLFYLFIFLFKGKPYLKEKISKNFTVQFTNLTLLLPTIFKLSLVPYDLKKILKNLSI